MARTIKYTETSLRQVWKLDESIALRVLDFLDEHVATSQDPRTQGENLAGPRMGSYWRYRLGDVRIICDIQDQMLLILLIQIR